MMTTYHKDIDKNGKTIYYRLNRKYRFVRASKAEVELELSTGVAEVVDYFPWKPVNEMTDRQVRAKLACAQREGDESGMKLAREELVKRGLVHG